QPLRVFDLRRLRWIDGVRLPRQLWLMNRHHPPRLLGDGRLMHVDYTYWSSDPTPLFAGIRRRGLADRASILIESDAPSHATTVTATGDLFYYVTDTQKVALIPHDANAATLLD